MQRPDLINAIIDATQKYYFKTEQNARTSFLLNYLEMVESGDIIEKRLKKKLSAKEKEDKEEDCKNEK